MAVESAGTHPAVGGRPEIHLGWDKLIKGTASYMDIFVAPARGYEILQQNNFFTD